MVVMSYAALRRLHVCGWTFVLLSLAPGHQQPPCWRKHTPRSLPHINMIKESPIVMFIAGIIFCMRPANETTLQYIGWAHSQNDPWCCVAIHMLLCGCWWPGTNLEPGHQQLPCRLKHIYQESPKITWLTCPVWLSIYCMALANGLVPIWHQGISSHHADLGTYQESPNTMYVWHVPCGSPHTQSPHTGSKKCPLHSCLYQKYQTYQESINVRNGPMFFHTRLAWSQQVTVIYIQEIWLRSALTQGGLGQMANVQLIKLCDIYHWKENSVFCYVFHWDLYLTGHFIISKVPAKYTAFSCSS